MSPFRENASPEDCVRSWFDKNIVLLASVLGVAIIILVWVAMSLAFPDPSINARHELTRVQDEALCRRAVENPVAPDRYLVSVGACEWNMSGIRYCLCYFSNHEHTGMRVDISEDRSMW